MLMKKIKISFNAPVTLSFLLLSLAVLILKMIFGQSIVQLFGVYYTSWADPFMYLRLFTHIFTHADIAHFTGNFMLILITGPLIEEKYGKGPLVTMILTTAGITGFINVLFFSNVVLIGASGIAFMLILLSSFVNIRQREIPLTVILVSVLYIGNEIITGITANDQVSQMAHIIGGICGAVFGVLLYRGNLDRSSL